MEGSRRLHGQSVGVFNEGICLVLSRWSALRSAVENEWGGRESRLKADQLASGILNWFTQSKGISINTTSHFRLCFSTVFIFFILVIVAAQSHFILMT